MSSPPWREDAPSLRMATEVVCWAILSEKLVYFPLLSYFASVEVALVVAWVRCGLWSCSSQTGGAADHERRIGDAGRLRDREQEARRVYFVSRGNDGGRDGKRRYGRLDDDRDARRGEESREEKRGENTVDGALERKEEASWGRWLATSGVGRRRMATNPAA